MHAAPVKNLWKNCNHDDYDSWQFISGLISGGVLQMEDWNANVIWYYSITVAFAVSES